MYTKPLSYIQIQIHARTENICTLTSRNNKKKDIIYCEIWSNISYRRREKIQKIKAGSVGMRRPN